MPTKSIPLITECLGGSSSSHFGATDEPTFNFEAQTASGDVYIIPVSLRAAHRMLMYFPPNK